MTTTTLGAEPETAQIMYRDSIETKAGQTRNNILYIYLPSVSPGSPEASMHMNVDIKTFTLPDGFTVNHDGTGFGPVPGVRSEVVLEIEISSQVNPGSYDLEFDVNINSEDYGQLPCRIIVTK